jgi:hypothetical protein
MAEPSALLTIADRRAAGHAQRGRLSRSAHAEWTPPPDRPGPVDLLIAQSAQRIPELMPLRHGRMRTDPFAFLRGAACVIAVDLGLQPNTGLHVQACGDAHLANFGAIAGQHDQGLFDLNDFDETLPAPFEWDVKRLATSLAVAALVQSTPDKACRSLARRAAHAYRREMEQLAVVPPIDAWYARIGLDAAIEDIADRDIRRTERRRLHQAVQTGRDGYAHLISSDGRLRLAERPPTVTRLNAQTGIAHQAFSDYIARLPEERQVLLLRHRLRDVMFKAVGVGSVGTFCAIGLFATADGDTLLLQLKEAQDSVLAPQAGPSRYAHQGQRVVVGQRLMQAEPDVFLGWASAGERYFYIRQLKDSRLASIGAQIEASSLPFYARLCGRTLARAHARSGDAAMISGYLGDGDSFDEAIAGFAMAYADQTIADHRAFLTAIANGRIQATPEPRR